jgi:quercetin dioxygenase-like cupin family protein
MSDATIPADDLKRQLVVANPEEPSMPQIGLVGDTYTVLLSGKDTADRYCVIDMYVPPGGGPPPHRHDFEETFIVLGGELEARLR